MSLRRLARTVRRGAQSIVRNPAIQLVAGTMFPVLAPFIALAQARSTPRESPVYADVPQPAQEFPPAQSQYQPQSFLPLLAGAGAVAARVLPIAVQGAQMLYNRYARSDPDDEDDFEEEDFDDEEDFE